MRPAKLRSCVLISFLTRSCCHRVLCGQISMHDARQVRCMHGSVLTTCAGWLIEKFRSGRKTKMMRLAQSTPRTPSGWTAACCTPGRPRIRRSAWQNLKLATPVLAATTPTWRLAACRSKVRSLLACTTGELSKIVQPRDMPVANAGRFTTCYLLYNSCLPKQSAP